MSRLADRVLEYGNGVEPRPPVLAATSGVGAVVLIIGSFAAGGSQPAADAPVEKVVAFYGAHAGAQVVSGVLLGAGALLFLTFGLTIAAALRRRLAPADADWPAALVAGGAVVVTTGLSLFAALTLAIGQVAGHIDPVALQALNVLNQDLFVPLTVGVSAFMLGAGISVRQTGAMPSWVGSVAVAFGIVGAVPSHVLGGVLDHIGFLAFAGMCLWTLLASYQMGMRRYGH